MKKLTLAVLAVAIMGTTTLAQADTRTASAVASWDAKAYKDTKSMLVVTPLKSLTFNYAEVTCPPKTSPFFKLVVEWTWEDGKWLRKHLPRNRLSLSFGK